jgi:hypothetical protein
VTALQRGLQRSEHDEHMTRRHSMRPFVGLDAFA